MVPQARQVEPEGQWLTIREAAELVGVSTATLRRWADAGTVETYTTPGGHRRFSRASVLGLLPHGHARPSLEEMGESSDRLTRVYHRQLRQVMHESPRIEAMDEGERSLFREPGLQISAALLIFLDAPTPEARESALADAERACSAYGRLACSTGLTLSETVELFLRFRMVFLHEIASTARRRALDTTEATELLESATVAFDRLVKALLSAYEQPGDPICAPKSTAPPHTQGDAQ